MACDKNRTFLLYVILVLTTVCCYASAVCPSSGPCHCEGTNFICNFHSEKDLLLPSELAGLVTSVQFLNCMYEANVSSIQYENVMSLIIDNCAVTSLPENSFASTATLEQLTLTGNRIRQVNSNAFMNLNVLTDLDLSNNELKSLPSGLFQPLIVLRRLDLSGNNQLVTVDWATLFKTASSSLTTFLCNRCGLQQEPTALFDKVPNLRSLELNNNNFSTSLLSQGGGAFRLLSKLTDLSLEENKLATLTHDAFSGLSQSLQSLRLGNNKISAIKGVDLQSFQHLQRLALHDNLLASLDKNDIPQSLFASDVTNSLELANNPWLCDSKLIWLRNIDQRKLADSEEMRCSSPQSKAGQSMFKIPVEAFQTNSSPSSVAVAAIVLWTMTAFVALVLFVRRVYIKRKQRSSPSRYVNVASTAKGGLGIRQEV